MEERAHRKLDVWKRAMGLTKMVYEITANFPKEEYYSLVMQMRRAAISVPSNLAEGAARSGKKEFLQFINIAQGSLSELDTQIELARMLHYLKEDGYLKLQKEIQVISKQLYGLSRAVRVRK